MAEEQPADTGSARSQTFAHIKCVRGLLTTCANTLVTRAIAHDATKLHEPEASVFEEFTPKLRGLTYGSTEYKEVLAAMKPALDHHYACNRHHPEHFAPNHFLSATGMNLFDVLEMLCDWLAATKRHADGDIFKSLEINQKRFGYSDEFKGLLRRTVDALLAMDAEAQQRALDNAVRLSILPDGKEAQDNAVQIGSAETGVVGDKPDAGKGVCGAHNQGTGGKAS